MVKLENENIKVLLKELGAELTSIINKKNNKEYLWQGLPEFWNGQAPILFPFVGRLSNDLYKVSGNEYSLPQHGFARRQIFQLVENKDLKVCFSLNSNEEIIKNYPFLFCLKVSYFLRGSVINVNYQVENKDTKPIYFSIGAHPGFNCPLAEGLDFKDYYLQFNQKESAEIHLLSGPLFSGETRLLLKNEDRLSLSYDLFKNDALVFKGLLSDEVIMKTDKSTEFVKMKFTGFPDLGIWTKPGMKAPYLCIEPWYGRADKIDFDDDIKKKYGIIELAEEKVFSCTYEIEIG